MEKENCRPPGLKDGEVRDPLEGRGVALLGKDGKPLFDIETGEPLFSLTAEEIFEDMKKELKDKGITLDGNK